MLSENKPFINSVNLHADTDFPYLFLNVTQTTSFPMNPGFRVPHWHEDLQFIYVLEGRISVKTLDETVEIEADEGIFINKNVVHLVQPIGLCHYNSYLFPDYFLSFYTGSPAKQIVEQISGNYEMPLYFFSSNVEWHKTVLAIFKKLSVLEANKGEFYKYEVMVLLTTLWLTFCKNSVIPKDEQRKPLRTRMKTFLAFIQAHYGEDISLEELAKSANVSVSVCLRCFKESLQMTPYQYLMEYRLFKAAAMLRDTDEPISTIAFKVGFGQSSHFAQCFKAKLGCTPREYRKKVAAPYK